MKLIRVYLAFFFRYVRFYWDAVTEYDIDSPYLFRFIAEVLLDKRPFGAFRRIEQLRATLRNSPFQLSVEDLGAGSMVQSSLNRRISDIVRYAAVSDYHGQLLFRTALWLKPRGILELGTSLGISTAYLGLAASTTPMVSMEGCAQTAAQARLNLDAVGANHVSILVGSFESHLKEGLERVGTLDLLYLDGDHRKEPVVQYTLACLEKAPAGAVFIIGDIHWSAQMEEAWRELKQLPKVSASIDLFHLGILFLNPDINEKRHISFVPWRYKPWRLGIFR